MKRRDWTAGFLRSLLAMTVLLAGCSSAATSDSPPVKAASALPDTAYRMKPGLPKWVDPETQYDTTRTWKMDGGEWPILLAMSPSQSPQLLAGWEAGHFQKALGDEGITPKIEKLDGPPRVFRALERSKWPFAYVPLAVFMDYVRSADNQGGAGGLQYVAIAGSTAGGGYTLLTKDPAIESIADLKGKKVGFLNTNPVPGTLLTKAAEQAKLGKGDIQYGFGEAGEQMNRYTKGEFDAVVSLNIYKAQLLSMGSRTVTDFAGVDYRPNYTILCVERSVLEERPEVVDAFLEAHYQGNGIAVKQWDGEMRETLRTSWNDFFASQGTKWSNQRDVPDAKAFGLLLGNMWPEMRLDRDLVADCFGFNTAHETWGWAGAVDTGRLVDYGRFDKILAKHGERPQ